MDVLKKYYKVTDGSSWCVWETLEEAQEMAIFESLELENNYGIDYAFDLLSIEECFMTEEEFNNLDEFDGF